MGIRDDLENAIYGPLQPKRHSCMDFKPAHHANFTCPECGQEWSFDTGGPGQCWRPVEPADQSTIYYAARIEWPRQ